MKKTINMKNNDHPDYIPGARKTYKNVDDIFNQLSKVKGFKINKDSYGTYMFELGGYYGRFLTKYHEEPHPNDEKVFDWYIIQFAIKDYFDRWANSTNFEMIVHAANDNPNFLWDIKKVIEFMDMVTKMPYFNWNSYFHTIEIPFQQKKD